MIELSEQQAQAIGASGEKPLTVMDPRTNTSYVLIRKDVYEQMLDYDDSPWTDEEMDALHAEIDDMLDDDMAIEDAP